MNCEKFQNEFELRSALSSGAALHLDSCADCHEHSRLLELLSGLERVEVPKDFDFQLNVRIARGKPSRSWIELIPSLQFVLPLALVVVSIAALSGVYFFNKNSFEPIAINDVAAPDLSNELLNVAPDEDVLTRENEKPKTGIELSNSLLELIKSPEIATKDNEANQKSKASQSDPNSIKDAGAGSRDSAVTSIAPLIQPEFDSNRKVDSSAILRVATVTKLSDVWNLLGITVDSLKVVSVGKISVAERSGVKTGDLIEAIDGEKITSESITGNQIHVKSITVVRNGIRREVLLTNF